MRRGHGRAEWSKERTIDELLKKAKYKAPITAETYRTLKLTRYQARTTHIHLRSPQQSVKITTTYAAWLETAGPVRLD